MRKRSTESTIKDPIKKDKSTRKSSLQQKYQYDNSYTRRWNNGFIKFILQVMQKKFAVFGILSFTVLLMVAIHIKFLKSFSTERDSKVRPFPPNPEMPLPPSSSLLHQFENAAINSDSEECSLIGSFCHGVNVPLVAPLPKQFSVRRPGHQKIKRRMGISTMRKQNEAKNKKTRIIRRTIKFRSGKGRRHQRRM